MVRVKNRDSKLTESVTLWEEKDTAFINGEMALRLAISRRPLPVFNREDGRFKIWHNVGHMNFSCDPNTTDSELTNEFYTIGPTLLHFCAVYIFPYRTNGLSAKSDLFWLHNGRDGTPAQPLSRCRRQTASTIQLPFHHGEHLLEFINKDYYILRTKLLKRPAHPSCHKALIPQLLCCVPLCAEIMELPKLLCKLMMKKWTMSLYSFPNYLLSIQKRERPRPDLISPISDESVPKLHLTGIGHVARRDQLPEKAVTLAQEEEQQ
ncbi:uncharacterized protein LOC123522538 [Echinops telfairi]|uniref:Uncharacterized protein LOC123522538 n=1 Tax=Echinops telfairi TaxID=9371 RepID=A0AC55DPJ4_ECHTE|nr:uncharacterized protein LOC123522538 [Echinops telfairi]